LGPETLLSTQKMSPFHRKGDTKG